MRGVEGRGRAALGDLREQRLADGRRRGDGEQEEHQDWLGLPHFRLVLCCVGIDAVKDGTYVRPISISLYVRSIWLGQCMQDEILSGSVLLDQSEFHFSTFSSK